MDKPIPNWIWQNLEKSDRKSSKMPGDPQDYDWVETQPKPCEHCGDSVVDRRESQRIVFHPKLHWRRKCDTCKKYWHWEEGEYSIIPQRANYYHVSRLKDK
jgi:hypothetical protein